MHLPSMIANLISFIRPDMDKMGQIFQLGNHRFWNVIQLSAMQAASAENSAQSSVKRNEIYTGRRHDQPADYTQRLVDADTIRMHALWWRTMASALTSPRFMEAHIHAV